MMPMNSMKDCIGYIEQKAKIVNEELQRYMSGLSGAPALIQSAMSYSLLSGGKRIRPVLLLAANDMLGGSEKRALPFACALEMIDRFSEKNADTIIPFANNAGCSFSSAVLYIRLFR